MGRGLAEDDGYQPLPFRGERVHHHLSVAAGANQILRAQGAEVMGDEVRRALADPGEIADAELSRFPEGGGEHQPGGIGKRSDATGGNFRRLRVEPAASELFRERKVDAQQVAAIVSDPIILTMVEVLLARRGAILVKWCASRRCALGFR